MTVVEFGKRRRRSVERKGMGLRGAVESDLGFAEEFAKESGISRATLSKIEQGHIYPSMQIRRKLAKALGVGPQVLWNARPEDLKDRSQQRRKQAS
jgi:transcriptional regulator with XRE-family HTH domain